MLLVVIVDIVGSLRVIDCVCSVLSWRRYAAPSRPSYTPEPASSPPRRPLKRGSRVRHPTLGPGVILEMEGDGDEARLTVFFEKSGKRKLVAKFANLEMM